jgi:hypothetical protein
MRRRHDLIRCALAILLAAGAFHAAPSVKLVSNRETFDVSLERTSGSVVAAHGRTVIEFRALCDGYSTVQRSMADMVSAHGEATRTDFTTRYWESRDGRKMRFEIANRQNGKITDGQKGVAALISNGTGRVALASRHTVFSLPYGTLFPTGETLDILRAAVKGESSLTRTIYQGGNKSALHFSTATIGPPLANANATEDVKDPAGMLRGVRAWPVLISFFSPDAEMPDSEIATRIYANGLLGSLSLVYPDYTLRARLTRVERLPSSC